VDPFPDACSAVMCLNCGSYYCNYCFMGFSTGDADTDRGNSHAHAAEHHPGPDKDPFLPLDVIKDGQSRVQCSQLVKCASLAMRSKEYGANNKHAVALSLVLLTQELSDLGIEARDVWAQADRALRQHQTPHSSNHQNTHYPDGVDHTTGGPQLANALKSSNRHAVRQILQAFRNNLDINYKDPEHGHPLVSLALLAKQKDIAIQLLRRGADPTLCSLSGRSVLFVAVEIGILEILKVIMESFSNIDVNAPVTAESCKYTMLHVAARYNHGHLVDYLLSLGADINLREHEFGYSPLMLALISDSGWAGEVLIAHGADPRTPSTSGRNSLFLAVERENFFALDMLLSMDCVGINDPVCASDGMNPLHVAVCHQKHAAVSYLLEKGADVYCVDRKHGYTPLMVAIISSNSLAALQLIRAGADVHRASRSGRTAIYMAVEKGLVDVVRALVREGGVDVNARATAEHVDGLLLTIAIIYGRREVVGLLLDLGAEPNVMESISRNTPLMAAVMLDDYWSANKLLDRGADPTSLSAQGRTLLYVAAEKGNAEMIRLIAQDKRIDINSPATSEPSGLYALHVAILLQKTDAVHQLLKLGADIHVRDSQGRSAIDMTRELEQDSPGLYDLLHQQRSRSERNS